MNLDALFRLLSPIKRSISTLITKGVVSNIVTKKSGETQRIQVDLGNDQVLDNVEQIQPFGLSSVPPIKAQALVLSLAGNRDHPVIIQIDDNDTRIEVNQGDVALYNSSGLNIELRGEEILLGVNKQMALVPLDGVMTGQAIDSFLGVPMGTLPGMNDLGTSNSQKLKVQL